MWTEPGGPGGETCASVRTELRVVLGLAGPAAPPSLAVSRTPGSSAGNRWACCPQPPEQGCSHPGRSPPTGGLPGHRGLEVPPPVPPPGAYSWATRGPLVWGHGLPDRPVGGLASCVPSSSVFRSSLRTAVWVLRRVHTRACEDVRVHVLVAQVPFVPDAELTPHPWGRTGSPRAPAPGRAPPHPGVPTGGTPACPCPVGSTSTASTRSAWSACLQRGARGWPPTCLSRGGPRHQRPGSPSPRSEALGALHLPQLREEPVGPRAQRTDGPAARRVSACADRARRWRLP